MKLNLGCGTDTRVGFVNIDMRDNPGVDKICDISKGLPYHDNEAEYILARDILEHFGFRETEPILLEWKRVLAPGGTLEIQVPNIDKHFKDYWDDRHDKRYQNGYDDAFEFLRANIFGGQDYAGNYHKTCFTPNNLKRVLLKLGFHAVEIILSDRAIIATCKK